MSEAGAALVIDDSRARSGHPARTVADLFADPRRLERMSAASRALARPDAAERIAEQVLAAAAPRAAGGEQPVTSTQP